MTEARVMSRDEVLNARDFGHGWLECWVEDEKTGEAYTDLVEIAWLRGNTIEMYDGGGLSYGDIGGIAGMPGEYNRPGHSRIWTEEPSEEQRERAGWVG